MILSYIRKLNMKLSPVGGFTSVLVGVKQTRCNRVIGELYSC